MTKLFRNVCRFSRALSLLHCQPQRCAGSNIGEVGGLVLPSKESPSVEADVVNYGNDGLYFSAYNSNGFLLNSGISVIGPCAAFPRNAFCWNVKDAMDIDEDSLSLFLTLEPKLEVLVIGKGVTKAPVDHRKIFEICSKHKLPVEILPTQTAIGTFNFLNSEGRYVAAALIPPHRLDVYDKADSDARRLLAESQSKESESALLQPDQQTEPQRLLLDSSPNAPRLESSKSPLADTHADKTKNNT